jgi:beta-galactosidase
MPGFAREIPRSAVIRRDFIKTTGALLATTALSNNSRAASPPAQASRIVEGRLTLPINRNWRFKRIFPQGAEAKAFDDSTWEQVAVPHTNIRLSWHSFDEKSYQFVSAYRRRFVLPSEARGRRVFADFEGVMTASTVWLNGELLGEYRGGYTPFSFELAPHIDFSGKNVLAVKIDSTEREDIPPFGFQLY